MTKATLLLALTACKVSTSTSAMPVTSPPPNSAEPSDAPPPGKATRAKIQREAEAGLVAWYGNKGNMCGGEFAVRIDWASFDWDSWEYGIQKSRDSHTPIPEVVGFCFRDLVDDAFEYLCSAPDMREYGQALARVRTVTCHVVACDKVVRALPGDEKSGPGTTYTVAKDGIAIDVSVCWQTSRFGSFDARYYLKQQL